MPDIESLLVMPDMESLLAPGITIVTPVANATVAKKFSMNGSFSTTADPSIVTVKYQVVAQGGPVDPTKWLPATISGTNWSANARAAAGGRTIHVGLFESGSITASASVDITVSP